jgi:type III pantothenate kinase
MNVVETESVIAVDIGNQQIKLGLLTGCTADGLPEPRATWKTRTAEPDLAALHEWLPSSRLAWCVATVHREGERRLADWVRRHRQLDTYLRLQHPMLPIGIGVDQPDRVGADRLLAAVAANTLRDPFSPAVIVDAGTAITVDLVSADGVFQGGVILAGFGTMARALAREADALPLVEYAPEEPPPVVGKSTTGAIRSGLFWGCVGAVRELLRRMTEQLGQEPQLFVAGGDAARLAPFLTHRPRIVPELVLSGIGLAWRHIVGHVS